MNRKRNRRPTHPGITFKADVLEPSEVSITAAANAMGVTRKHLSAVVNGNATVTPDMALRMALFTDTTPESWLNMQLAVDIWELNNKPKPDVRSITSLPAAYLNVE